MSGPLGSHLLLILIPILLLAIASLFPLFTKPGARPTDDNHWKGIFYVNRDDPALWIPKRFGIGYTLNFGNPWSWAVMGLILAAVLAPIFLVLRALPHSTRFH
jgi:uncharacterized membrane protein